MLPPGCGGSSRGHVGLLVEVRLVESRERLNKFMKKILNLSSPEEVLGSALDRSVGVLRPLAEHLRSPKHRNVLPSLDAGLRLHVPVIGP